MMAVALPLLGGCATLPAAGALPAGYESADASTAVDPAAIDAWWTLYGDAVPVDGLPFGDGVPPSWTTSGIDLIAALSAAGYKAGTVTTACLIS